MVSYHSCPISMVLIAAKVGCISEPTAVEPSDTTHTRAGARLFRGQNTLSLHCNGHKHLYIHYIVLRPCTELYRWHIDHLLLS